MALEEKGERKAMGLALEKMVSGSDYNFFDDELDQLRQHCWQRMQTFNQGGVSDQESMRELFHQLIPGASQSALILPPFFCTYGINLTMDEESFFNFNCTVLDNAPVHIGKRVMIGPNSQIYTAAHDLDPVLRAQGIEKALAVTVEDDVWIGGGAIILPGVTIGKEAVVGAGSVVTRDVPAGARVAGNPARRIDK